MTCDIVILGGANTDYVVRGSMLPGPGETVDGTLFQEGCGGKGANAAVAAARLDASVALISRVGRDSRGDRIIQTLRKEGIDTQYVSHDADAATGVALVMVEQQTGEKQILTALGANRRLTIDEIKAASELIGSAKVLLAQLEVPMECVVKAARIAYEAGVKVILDPAPPRSLPDDLFRMIHILKPNASEAEALTGIKVADRASARQAAKQLLKEGVAIVAIQAGHDGNLLVWQENEHWLPHIPVESVDATGAGDTFAAALAVATAEGRSLREAGSLANAAAALATTTIGAQTGLPRREEVEKLLAHQST
jgi:ribokinase